jgi:hypothetical protein
MRFLVALRHPGYLRHLESTLRELCERGHEIAVLVGITASKSGSDVELLDRQAAHLDELPNELDGLSVRPGVEPRGSRRTDLGGSLRAWRDYLRFLEPELADAPKPRDRARRGVPAPLREPTDLAAASPDFRASLAALLDAMEAVLPVSNEALAVIANERPDAVVVCPLLERRSPQVVYLRAARALGVPSALCVASWDNLTTTGLIHGSPDLITVWNEAQRREVADLHGIAASRVAVTGAPLHDPWFDQLPGSSREQFCRAVGLPPERPFLLYVCSSGFIAPDEADWIPRWIRYVRASGEPELADIPVLVRPHPQHRLLNGSAEATALDSLPGVVIHPREPVNTAASPERSVYFDSIHHAAAVAGVNTSAMIESAIVGRGVHVFLAKRYRDTQDGLPHFAHLCTEGGGLIQATRDRQQHAAGLARAVRGQDSAEVAERSRRFLGTFVRPHGLDQPATPVLVNELERLAAAGTPGSLPAEPWRGQLDEAIATLERTLRVQRGGSR